MPEVSTSHVVLIPTYNTGDLVLETVHDALKFWAPVWVVIDGSTDGTAEKLEALEDEIEELRVFRLARNQGKGAAVLHTAIEAGASGFTHILTFDADGQHPADRIPQYMEMSKLFPRRMIIGKPIFDSGAPLERVIGHGIGNFFTNLESVFSGVGDSLFGMRIYPVDPLLNTMKQTRWGKRFDFEPEAVVRMVWSGIRPQTIQTPVRYLSKSEGGVSHFNYLKVNALLVWMHFRLLLGTLIRLPGLLSRRRRWLQEDQLKNPNSKYSRKIRTERIADRYVLPWHHHYVRTKLRNDPLYEAVESCLETFDPEADLPIIDIGCGMGLLFFHLRERDYTSPYLGIDSDSRKIKAANRVLKEFEDLSMFKGVIFRTIDATEPNWPSFQGHAMLLDVLPYIPEEERTTLLKRLADSVAPRGLLIVRDGFSNFGSRPLAFWKQRLKKHPHAFPEFEMIDAILTDCGLTKIETAFRGHLLVYQRYDQTGSDR